MSGDWWAKVFARDRLCEVIRRCIWWAETCPCHGDLLKAAADHGEPLDPAASKEMQTCPLRGLRLCELAAGDLFKYFEDLCHTAILQVMHGLPQGLQPALRADLVNEFEAGRSYLVFQMSLKLSSYMAPPCLLFACAHHDRTVQHRALRQCLHASSSHPRVLELQCEPLRSEAVQFLEGGEVFELDNLMGVLAALKFGSCTERLVEGGRGFIHLKTSSS